MNTPFNLKQRGLTLALVSTFAIGATISGQSVAAADTATATATVITPIAIASTKNLEFGSFAPGAGGTVTVSTSGARTGSGVILSSVGAATTAAKFDVTGTGTSTYAISYTGTSATLLDSVSSETMALALISDLDASNTTTAGTVDTGALTAGAQSIYVGGILTVGAGQAAGTYSGVVDVQVEYN